MIQIEQQSLELHNFKSRYCTSTNIEVLSLQADTV